MDSVGHYHLPMSKQFQPLVIYHMHFLPALLKKELHSPDQNAPINLLIFATGVLLCSSQHNILGQKKETMLFSSKL